MAIPPIEFDGEVSSSSGCRKAGDDEDDDWNNGWVLWLRALTGQQHER